MNILLVEDHPFQQQVLLNQLRQVSERNCKFATASTGREALNAMLTFKPDVLVCDLNMPEMDGITFLGHLAEQGFSGCIIITSAASSDVIRSVSKMCQNYKLHLIGSLNKPATNYLLHQYLSQAQEYILTAQPHSQPQYSVHLAEQDIQYALEAGWLLPYFQPIVDIATGQWVSCEALIRMRHPKFGVLSPASFLPQLSAMRKDADLALNSIHFILKHHDELQQRKVAVNITPHTLISNGFVDKVIAISEHYPMLPKIIYFEITESDALENVGRSLEAAARLGMHGFKLSIDDFGTGYSSLKQLDLLPFTSLKIDMSFVQALPTSRTANAIIEASLLLAERLELDTIAEGIEDIALWQSLRKMGCKLAQGYYIARPMPINHLESWHQQWLHRFPVEGIQDVRPLAASNP
ncbi:EAL domain-containing response regulator [Photobacterium minamisatsumaniensis]|uniref:EAL domain-containing response regulator n=1 Tax=Photobacterium minamisatsumaniensis TaxID=2910233 RepID=UPI003D0AE86A